MTRAPALAVHVASRALAAAALACGAVGGGGGCITHRILVDDERPGAPEGALRVNQGELKRVEGETAQRRHLPFLKDVPADIMTVNDLRAWFDRYADARKAELAKEDRFFHRTNILPPTTSTAEAYKGFLADFVGGVYDDGTGRMILVSDYAWWSKLQQDLIGAFTGVDWAYEVFLSHELVHALQDQHFGLGDMLKGGVYDDNDDAAFVRKTLLETEANVVGMSHFLGMDLEQLATRKSFFLFLRYNNLLNGPFLLALAGRTPSYFAKQAFAQYELGLSFVEKKLDEGGMDALSRSYVTLPGTPGGLPESTEQLLWPRKMRPESLDRPVPIARLTAAPAALPSSSLILTNVFGALAFKHYLERYVGSIAANGVGDGWGGDRWDIVDDGGVTVLIWRTRWDTEQDAQEMLDAYASALPARYGSERIRGEPHDEHGPPTGNRREWRVTAGPKEERTVRTTRDEAVVVERRGRDVLIVEGATPERTGALVDEMWAQLQPAPHPQADSARIAQKAAQLEEHIGRVDDVEERPGLLGRLFLPARTMAVRMGTGVGVDQAPLPGQDPLFLLNDSEMRWGFRPHLELSLPFALAGEIMSPVGQTVVAVAAGLGSTPSASVQLGHAVPVGEDLALVGQAGVDDAGDDAFVATRFAGGALLRPFGPLVLAPSLARVERVNENVTDVSDPEATRGTVIIGSALRRGFVAQPLVEAEVVDGLFVYESSTLFFDEKPRGLSLRAHTHVLGLLLYF